MWQMRKALNIIERGGALVSPGYQHAKSSKLDSVWWRLAFLWQEKILVDSVTKMALTVNETRLCKCTHKTKQPLYGKFPQRLVKIHQNHVAVDILSCFLDISLDLHHKHGV